MKIKVITCEALVREFYHASATSPHIIDIQTLAFGLHNTPDELRKTIQEAVDACEGKKIDCIVLGYGLCSRGTAEIRARSIPIVLPRMHDCITAFLGSRARYNKEFSAHPGTYYYSPGWIERKEGEIDQGVISESHARAYEERYKEYVEKYGEDNAKFLIEQEKQWYSHYTRAAFIDMGIGDIEMYREFTQALAKDHNWEYAEMQGDFSLIRRLVYGEWDGDDFLKVEPGQMITESFDDLVLKVKNSEEKT